MEDRLGMQGVLRDRLGMQGGDEKDRLGVCEEQADWNEAAAMHGPMQHAPLSAPYCNVS